MNMKRKLIHDAELFTIYYLDKQLYKQKNNLSLGDGIPGYCLLLAEFLEDSNYLRSKRDTVVIEMVNTLNKTELNLSLWGGLCGIAVGVSALNIDQRYDRVLYKIEEKIIISLKSYFKNLDLEEVNLYQNQFKYYDLFSGFSGVLAYLVNSTVQGLELQRKELVNRIITYFSRLTRSSLYKEKQVKNYSILPDNLPASMESELNEGAIILGKSHGISGILSSVNMASNSYATEPIEELKEDLRFELEHHYDENYIFPTFLSINGSIDKNNFINNSWCYGSFPILNVLLSVKKSKKYKNWHKNFLLSENLSGYQDVDIFCHGKAGLAYLFHNYYLGVGEKTALNRRNDLLTELYETSKINHTFKYRDNHSNDLTKKVGLLEGQIGVHLTLVNIIKEKKFDKDWIFLIDKF